MSSNGQKKLKMSRAGLTFVVKDENGKEVGTYKLGTDFDEEKDDDGKVTGYSKTIEVPVGKYTVEETLYKVDGSKVTVSYKVDGGESKEGTKTDEFSVERGKTATVEYEDKYEKDSSKDGSRTDTDDKQSSESSTDGGNGGREPSTGDETSVETGDRTEVMTLVIIALISLTALAVFKKKDEDAE